MKVNSAAERLSNARIVRLAPLPHLRPDEIDQKIAILAGQVVDLEDAALRPLTSRNRLDVGRENAPTMAYIAVIERSIMRSGVMQLRRFVRRVQNRIHVAHDRIIENFGKCRENTFIAGKLILKRSSANVDIMELPRTSVQYNILN